MSHIRTGMNMCTYRSVLCPALEYHVCVQVPYQHNVTTHDSRLTTVLHTIAVKARRDKIKMRSIKRSMVEMRRQTSKGYHQMVKMRSNVSQCTPTRSISIQKVKTRQQLQTKNKNKNKTAETGAPTAAAAATARTTSKRGLQNQTT